MASEHALAQEVDNRVRIDTLSHDSVRVIVDSFFGVTSENDFESIEQKYMRGKHKKKVSNLAGNKMIEACAAYNRVPRFMDFGLYDPELIWPDGQSGGRLATVRMTSWFLSACVK